MGLNTGEPKAIPWTHVTPIRCGADAWAHQDVRPGDTVAWPTNLGWMMGPWLLYAALLNGACIALYQVRASLLCHKEQVCPEASLHMIFSALWVFDANGADLVDHSRLGSSSMLSACSLAL